MFEYVRNHTKLMMGLLFLIIIPSFVLVGLDGYNRFREKGATVARVDGNDISQAEWEAAHKRETDRLRAMMPGIDAQLLDSAQARYSTLERMVRERVLARATQDARLQIGDARLARELQSNPTIAALRRADGTLDVDRYRQLVGSQGMTPEMYESSVRGELAVRQLQSGLTQTGFAVPALADLTLKAYFEKREVQLATFNVKDFAARVSPSDADLDAYYQANQALFRSPERASIEYIVLDLDAVKKTIAINEQDLKTYYEQNISRLSGNEQRRASHILIAAGKDLAAPERDKAKAKAEELLAQLRKSPDSFAELARKHSQDPGSASRGGDLDFFARGAMVKPFEDAAFAMTKGQISQVVESDFGYHIIRVTEIKEPKRKSFEELRPSLEAELKSQQAQSKFAEAAEIFTNGVYEQSDSLKSVADKLKLEIRKVADLRRQPAPGVSGVLSNPKLLAAIFSSDAIQNKRNTEAVEVGPSQLASARIVEHFAAKTLPLAEVRQEVRERVIASQAAELARQEGQKKLAEWKASPDKASLQAVQTLSRDQAQATAPQLLDAVLRADPASLPSLLGVDLGAQGYVIARVNRVIPRSNPSPEQLKQEREQLAQVWATAQTQAYAKMLQQRFKMEIKVPQPTAGVN
ncbi:MAG: SurA N-terminal domain-containing protein [Hylemonella sp.]